MFLMSIVGFGWKMFYHRFVQKNDGKHGLPLVEKFLRICSTIPEATPLFITVGLHCLKMLLILPEEHYFSQSSSSSVSAKAGSGHDALRVNSVWPKSFIVG